MKLLRRQLLLLLLLAYAVQSVAALASPCQMMGAGAEHVTGAATDMAAMDHAGHNMAQMAGGAPASSDSPGCCDGGLCSMSYCQSGAALPSSGHARDTGHVTIHNDSANFSALRHSPASPYRPPISR